MVDAELPFALDNWGAKLLLDILLVNGKQLPRSKREVQALRPQTASPRGSAERFKKSLNTHSRHLSTYQRLS